jgi:hypothetical protein
VQYCFELLLGGYKSVQQYALKLSTDVEEKKSAVIKIGFAPSLLVR